LWRIISDFPEKVKLGKGPESGEKATESVKNQAKSTPDFFAGARRRSIGHYLLT